MKIGPRTAKLLREAIVLAHVEGSRWGQCHDRNDEYPPDSEVVTQVLSAAVWFNDLYPTLSKLDDAQEARAEQRRQFYEGVAAMLTQGEADTSSSS